MAATKKIIQKAVPETAGEAATATATSSIKTDAIGGLIGSASRIVLKAAGILEEEIAKGILAARQVEDKFADVPKLRNGQITDNKHLDDLFVRFRKDAHDIIDLVVDFASIAAQSAGKVSAQFIKISSDKTTPAPGPSQQVPLIQVPQDLKAGGVSVFPVTLENDNTQEEKIISFVTTPLTNTAGTQLPAGAISFAPNPLKIPPAAKATVQVTISIPATAKPGSYTSFIQGKDVESLKASLLVKVIA